MPNQPSIIQPSSFRLCLLGCGRLVRDGRVIDRLSSQRQRLALLAIAAIEWKRGISRSKVAALLWPEGGEEHTRHGLAQLIYVMRRDLGIEDLFPGAADIRLASDEITVDLIDFEQALERGDLARAADLYAGPLLDGVPLAGSVEMERWVESHRERMHHQACDALVKLATAASAAGQWGDATRWWRRLNELEPFEARFAAQLICALGANGDRTAALKFAESYRRLLREELDQDLPAEVSESLHQAQSAVTPKPALVAATLSISAISYQDPYAVTDHATSRRYRLGKRGAKYVSAFAAILLAIAALVWRGTRAVPPPTLEGRAIILPFEIRGDPDLAFLRDGMVDLLATAFEKSTVLRPADPYLTLRAFGDRTSAGSDSGTAVTDVASQMGAEYFIRGQAMEAGSRVRLTATLFRAGGTGDPLARASAEGERKNLFALVDHLALELTANRIGGVAPQLQSEASQQGVSFVALRKYLNGESALRDGRYPDAIAAFQGAIADDSTFSIAYYRLCIAADWAGYSMAYRQKAVSDALRFSDRMPQREQLLLRAMKLTLAGDMVDAADIYENLLSKFPDDGSALMQFAELEFHYNQFRGRAFTDSRAGFERINRVTGGDPASLLHLARIAAHQRRTADVGDLMRDYRAARPADRDPEIALFVATALGDSRARDSVLRNLRKAGVDTIVGCAWRVAQFTEDFRTADRTLALLTAPERGVADRRAGYQFRATVGAIRGSWVRVRPMLDSLRGIDRVRALVLGARLAGVPDIGVPRDELIRMRDEFLDDGGFSPADIHPDAFFGFGSWGVTVERIYDAALLSAQLRDTAMLGRLERQLASIQEVKRDSTLGVFVAVLRARALSIAGNKRGALAVFHEITAPGRGQFAQLDPPSRFLFATLAEDTRDVAEALRWYDTFAGYFFPDLVFTAAAEKAQGRLLQGSGNNAEAAIHLARARAITG